MDKRTVEKLELLNNPEIRKAFLLSVEDMLDRVSFQRLVEAIETNNVDDILKAIGYSDSVFNNLLDKIDVAYKQAGAATVLSWKNNLQFVFNTRNHLAERDLKEHSSLFVSRIDSEIRENVRTVLTEGLQRGDNPRNTARQLVGSINPSTKKREGGVIGLTPKQALWSQKARERLENLDPSYLKLKLRDKRFDSKIIKAIEEQKPLKQTDIDRIVSSYNNKALKYRADVIARTETLQSITRAERTAYLQAFESGDLEKRDVQKYWDATGDSRTRTTHVILEQLFGKKNPIPFDSPFISPSGSRMMYPGDNSLGAEPEEIIQCRCMVIYVVDWLGRAKRRNRNV